jgi:hypothetical protein
MSKIDEYRSFAAACLDLAKATANRIDKTRLLIMAEAWLDLADRAAALIESPLRRFVEHPLVRRALGPTLPDAD